MNPAELHSITEEQKRRYFVQPDMLPSFQRSLDGDLEYSQYVKGSPFRFWFNNQPTGFTDHWHTAMEIIFTLENTYTIEAHQQKYVMEPGDIAIIPSGTVHSISSPEKGCRFVFMFEPNLFSQLPGFNYVLSLIPQPVLINYDTNPQLYRAETALLWELVEHYWGNGLTKDLNIFSTMIRFFSTFGEHTANVIPPTINNSSKAGSLVSRLSMVLDYLDTHYSENITLEEAANIACFSKFYFTRLFKQYTNQTFYDYLSTKRIKAAEQMLIIPNLPITEISLKAGFSSLSSFNRTFKRLKGCSPSEYRSLYSLENKIKKD
ncbi:MAG: AraC family transcriptional regulator [Acetatifactor sp.]|nr:AraC family transcriptional regulator [Acetatifactor sp.]